MEKENLKEAERKNDDKDDRPSESLTEVVEETEITGVKSVPIYPDQGNEENIDENQQVMQTLENIQNTQVNMQQQLNNLAASVNGLIALLQQQAQAPQNIAMLVVDQQQLIDEQPEQAALESKSDIAVGISGAEPQQLSPRSQIHISEPQQGTKRLRTFMNPVHQNETLSPPRQRRRILSPPPYNLRRSRDQPSTSRQQSSEGSISEPPSSDREVTKDPPERRFE